MRSRPGGGVLDGPGEPDGASTDWGTVVSPSAGGSGVGSGR